ncbi:ubiquitin-protein ligase [Lithospermum erythrorhizon]|uniref:RING-type E3 ubiquitin transferase n=1 Tax=Lithospermum erythrorhizon TaxID=34254 RepID=A0AAV3Q6Z7_LITER
MSRKQPRQLVPEDLRCPISLELMSDPVIISSGHTFDRSSIQRWFDSGHRTCPITKLPIPDPPTLIPNHTLRSLISSLSNTTPPLSQNNSPSSDPQTLVNTLLTCSDQDVKVNSLDQLSRISKLDLGSRRRLIEAGVVSALLNCLDSVPRRSHTYSDTNEVGDARVRVQEKALHLFLNLSLDDDNKVGLVAEGLLGKVVSALYGGAGDSRAVAATVLTSLAVVEVNKATIGTYPHAIPGLVFLLRAGNGRERKEAATALYALCLFGDNRVRAVENRAVGILLRNASAGLERAVEVLGLLAKCREGRNEMLNYGNGVLGILVNFLTNGSSRGVQYALLTINALCSYSEEMCFEATKDGVFEICVRLLEDDNEKVRRNAKCLIQVLQGRSFTGKC